MKRLVFPLLLAVSALCASVAPSRAQTSAADRFVSEGGFAVSDPDRVWDEINAALPGARAESVFLPAASLAPVPLALLALEASEPALERVRYRIRFGTRWIAEAPGGPPVPVGHVEVTRFNLGPAIRRQMVDAMGAEAVAGAEEFGVGPHVAWRLVTRPVMGHRAMVVAAGRMELDGEAAREEACFGTPCLDPAPALDTLVPWGGFGQVDADIRGEGEGGVLAPVQAAELLLGEVDHIEPGADPGEASVPGWAIEAVLEANLGQDAGLDGAYRWGRLQDDSVAAGWQRVLSFATAAGGVETLRAVAYECARGPGFAAPGEHCP